MTTPAESPTRRVLQLTVGVRHKDEYEGKAMVDLPPALCERRSVSRSTVLRGVRGHGPRGSSRDAVLSFSLNPPVVIGTADEPEKIEAVIPEVKATAGSNSLFKPEEADIV